VPTASFEPRVQRGDIPGPPGAVCAGVDGFTTQAMRYVRKSTAEMPPYTDKVVSDQEVADIHAYLRSLPSPAAAATIPLLR
jgi:mono/diheme cytochrome c family protein